MRIPTSGGGGILPEALEAVAAREEPLAAAGGGDPGALDVGLAREAAALAAGATPHVLAVFLGLIPTVLTVDHVSSAHRIQTLIPNQTSPFWLISSSHDHSKTLALVVARSPP